MKEIRIGQGSIRALVTDIVQAGTEAIVNAANSRLAGGGGVDGAIHRAAGPELYELTRPFGGCPTGSAVITGAGRMKAPTRYIIHAVGPVFSRAREDECATLLRSAYETSLRLAEQNGVASVAFPAISTGVYKYPIEPAARIAVDAVARHFEAPEPRSLEVVVFALFSARDYEVYTKLLEEAARTRA